MPTNTLVVRRIYFLNTSGVRFSSVVEEENCWLCKKPVCAVCGVCWVKSHFPGGHKPDCKHYTKECI